ncbi:MAG: protease SohB [Halomonadaceae bacterium]|nr:MAG: protease SohB [Halomonadaceae bacterium]
MEFLADYGLFLAKIATVLVALLVLVSVLMSAAQRGRQDEDQGELQVIRFNDRLKDAKDHLEGAMLKHGARKQWFKELRKKRKAQAKQDKADRPEGPRARLFVLDFNGDIKASDTHSLRRCISAVLAVANPDQDRVAIRLESAGGMVHSYGLASAQLDRIRQKGIPLTVCVDKVAASGGYMMACVADRIIASPFAILGSIGVVAQIPNLHRFLKKNDVDFEILTAGEHKRTLTVFGENTEKGRQKFRDDLEDTHQLFKQYVSEHRPAVDIDQVSNGDIWFGQRALEVQLVDELQTSDQYLVDACDSQDVMLVKYRKRKTLPEKLGMAASTVTESVVLKLSGLLRDNRFQ